MLPAPSPPNEHLVKHENRLLAPAVRVCAPLEEKISIICKVPRNRIAMTATQKQWSPHCAPSERATEGLSAGRTSEHVTK